MRHVHYEALSFASLPTVFWIRIQVGSLFSYSGLFGSGSVFQIRIRIYTGKYRINSRQNV